MRMLLLLPLLTSILFKAPEALAATSLPPRPANAASGSQFAARIQSLSAPAREAAILKELESGNVPEFLRNLTPVTVRSRDAAGRAHTATLRVMPDYLAIGSDQDFVRIPMTPDTAQAFAQRFGYSLPTTKIVDEINRQAQVRLNPAPLPAGKQMTSTDFFVRHQKMIEKQRQNGSQGKLTSGQKKDVVISKRLLSRPRQVAIYGWHQKNGRPIQPLSLVHDHDYADYSHGIRLVSQDVEVDGRPARLDDVIADQHLAALVSNEGAFPSNRIAYAKFGRYKAPTKKATIASHHGKTKAKAYKPGPKAKKKKAHAPKKAGKPGRAPKKAPKPLKPRR